MDSTTRDIQNHPPKFSNLQMFDTPENAKSVQTPTLLGDEAHPVPRMKAQHWGEKQLRPAGDRSHGELSLRGGSGHSKKPGQAVDVAPEWRRREAGTPLAFQE